MIFYKRKDSAAPRVQVWSRLAAEGSVHMHICFHLKTKTSLLSTFVTKGAQKSQTPWQVCYYWDTGNNDHVCVKQSSHKAGLPTLLHTPECSVNPAAENFKAPEQSETNTQLSHHCPGCGVKVEQEWEKGGCLAFWVQICWCWGQEDTAYSYVFWGSGEMGPGVLVPSTLCIGIWNWGVTTDGNWKRL